MTYVLHHGYDFSSGTPQIGMHIYIYVQCCPIPTYSIFFKIVTIDTYICPCGWDIGYLLWVQSITMIYILLLQLPYIIWSTFYYCNCHTLFDLYSTIAIATHYLIYILLLQLPHIIWSIFYYCNCHTLFDLYSTIAIATHYALSCCNRACQPGSPYWD